MGRGNFTPNSIYDLHYRMVYIPFHYYDEPEDGEEDDRDIAEDHRINCESIVDEVLDLCSQYSKTGRAIEREWHGQDERILFRNGALEVTVSDNEWSMAVIVRQLEADDYEPRDTHALTARHVDIMAVKLFRKLKQWYPDLSVRSSAWTSGKWSGDISHC